MDDAASSESLSKLQIDFSAPENLRKNFHLLSPQHAELARALVEMGQRHLFEHWPDPGVDDHDKIAFFDQVAWLDSSNPGGLASYIRTARELLADSKAGKNPFDGFTPSVPTGENLVFGDETFLKYEEAGIREAQNAAFVLVAGGLGERLGYNGIKVALPVETTTRTCFLQHYIENILALQEASYSLTSGESCKEIPLAIMTSDDTHARTMELLESNSYFGMKPGQVKLLKQEKVACLEDNDARLALDPQNKYRIQTKPHGHGDVHPLLYSSGLLCEWHDSGLRWVLFFQDTNGPLFKAIPASLGAIKQYEVNSLAVPRKTKEAIGGITRLTHKDGRSMVINVEYNQLDPLLRTTGQPDGDVNCETGYSPFPGNINQLILEVGPYIEELKKTYGAIKEFVNERARLEAPLAVSDQVVDGITGSDYGLVCSERNASSSYGMGYESNGFSLSIGRVPVGGSFSFNVPEDSSGEDTCKLKRKHDLIEALHLDLSRSDSEVKHANSDITKLRKPTGWVDTTLRLSFKHSGGAESSVPSNVCLQLSEKGTDVLPASRCPNDVSKSKDLVGNSIDIGPDVSLPRSKKLKFLASKLELSCPTSSTGLGPLTAGVSKFGAELPIGSGQTGIEQESTVSENLLYTDLSSLLDRVKASSGNVLTEDFLDNMASVRDDFEGGLNSQKCVTVDRLAKQNLPNPCQLGMADMTEATPMLDGGSNQNLLELGSGAKGKMNANDSREKLVDAIDSQNSLGLLSPDSKTSVCSAAEKDSHGYEKIDWVSSLDYLPSVDDDGILAANSGNELMDFASDPGFDRSIPENVHTESVGPVGQTCVEKSCGVEKIVSEKPAHQDLSFMHSSESLNSISSSNGVDFNHLANNNDRLPVQDSKPLIPLQNGASVEVLQSNIQQTQRVSNNYANSSGLAFCAPKKPVSSTYNAKSRTWRRVDNFSSASSGNNTPSSDVLMQKQFPKNVKPKITSTSYIRKGNNSLVRKATPVVGQTVVFPGSKQLITPGTGDEIKKRDGAGHPTVAADLPNLLRHWGMGSSYERPKTPPLSFVPKVPNHAASCIVNHISAAVAEPLQNVSPEIAPLLTEIPEKNHILESLVDVSRREASVVQPDPVNSLECRSEQHCGNVVVSKAKSVAYVKHKSNQLVASSVLPAGGHKASDKYYKRRKNQLIRTSVNDHVKLKSSVDNISLNWKKQIAGHGLYSTNFKKLLCKVSTKTKKPSKLSLVWTLRGSQSSKCNHENFLPQLFPWKRATYWRRNLTSRKWMLSKDRDTVYTKSKHGFSLQKMKVLGGSSLKWSKSMEMDSKKASQKASEAIATIQREKREKKGERLFRIGALLYKMDSTRRTLQRISGDDPSCSGSLQADKEVKKTYVPRRLVIGKHEYVRIGNGNQLIRDPKKRARILASEKVRWSLHTVRSRLSKKRKYCQFFTRFGKCNKSDGKCPYMHDPSKIAVCTKFLNGSCSNPDCKLTHQVMPERMQECSYYLQGLCNNNNCPYRHVHVDPNAPTCEGFLKGYCVDGDECQKRHSYVCPVYEATGSCAKGSKCKLHHPRARSKGKSKKQLRERNSQTRYFGSMFMNGHNSGIAISGKQPTINYGDAFYGDMPDFISIYTGEVEATENGDLEDQQTNTSHSGSVDSQLSGLDELIKPIHIMNI